MKGGRGHFARMKSDCGPGCAHRGPCRSPRSVGTTARRHRAQVMTFPAEPCRRSGSYCLGVGSSDGLQGKPRDLQQMADAAFFNLLFDFSLPQVRKAPGTSGKLHIFGDKTVEILSLMKIC